MQSTIIFAPNVNAGGGLVLLLDLVRSLPLSANNVLFLDQRIRSQIEPITEECTLFWVQRTLLGRLACERKLQKLATSHHQILCFHGIPPVFECKGNVSVYVQNRLLLGSLKEYGFPWRVRLRLLYEKLVLNRGHNKVTRFFVQTETMADILNTWLDRKRKRMDGHRPRVIVAPFSNSISASTPKTTKESSNETVYDFCYVADGQPHKNHSTLFAALRILANENIFPRIAITLGDNAGSILSEVANLQTVNQIKIENIGMIQHDSVIRLYECSRALIFPSLVESFGLPLIEASQLGLPIIAGELNFVRDVCSPAETFDPTSPRSIALAMKRFLKLTNPPRPIMSAEEFLLEWQKLDRR